MKTKLSLILIGVLLIVGCTKSATELLDRSQKSLDENQVELAINDLESLLREYPTDSLASLAQYKLATIHKNWKNDPHSAFDALQKTVKNYLGSIQAEQAQKELNTFSEWIINKSEVLRKQKLIKESIQHLIYMVEKFPTNVLAPKAQYLIGDIYMNDLRDFETAVKQYRKIVDNHSGSKQEPHAQFMIGYIYANALNDFDKARFEYNEFLKRFPKHELSPSVKFEIEFLGKDINEIPTLKHITS
ncbi:MAG: tetratricopeptide repeat protein [Candidatus Neomarinimicrobiota bacterium]|uniref:Outer membrane lipoprotein BamD-like domain-containing protein n=1 Tax=marine metagenome TaxID=408172 RepID=A0A381XAK3_9ZZZZ|nr:tetratricopeptide repeat protein [Candidatus Neomarinimicrobiota bacterium]